MSICAVVVTYKPDLNALGRLLDALIPQVTSIVMVDNGSGIDLQSWNNSHQSNAGELILLGENKGIAAAHNVGIQWARNHREEFVLLMDQDSVPMPDMVVQLRSTYIELAGKGVQVAALGPQFRDSHKGSLSQFVKVGALGFTLLACNPGSQFVEADIIVSSGSLLPIAAIEAVGLMDEGLFIDHVDTEWCLRAKSKGFGVFGVCDAVMMHTLGEKRKKIWFLRQRSVPFHHPFRYYYMFRNSVLLYRRSYIPQNWKLADIAKCFRVVVFFTLVAPNRFACLKMMLLGMVDGLKGVSGKRNE
ncbi:MAG: glycosyltransferase family 2 protein [Gallionella sp.]|jgi:rhamnosyltransferase